MIDNEASSKYRAPALDKGLDILELLAHSEEGLLQSEIAEQLGRKTSEIFRMLVVLRERGYVVQSSTTDRYELSLKLFELAHYYPPIKQILDVALPKMREISSQLLQACHLTAFHENDLLVIGHTESPAGMGFTNRTGTVMDLLATTSGPAILAFREQKEVERRINWYSQHNTVSTNDIKQFYKRIEFARENGYISFNSLQIQGIITISCPIRDFSGQGVAALTIPYLVRIDNRPQPTIQESIEVTQNMALSISNDLGFRSER